MATTKMQLLLIGILLSVAYGPLCPLAQPRLELDPVYSPPATIPSDPRELIYSAPAMDHMLEPVKVRVLDDNDNSITEPVTVVATTVLASGLPGDLYDGILCTHNKWTHRVGRCRYMDDDCEELSCNSTDPSYPFGKVEVISENGVATFPRLLHTRPSTNGQRRLEFSAEINSTVLNITTHPFDVDLQAARLDITSPVQGDPGTVSVNNPMTFIVQTMAEDPLSPGSYIPLVSGRHSTLNVDLTISYDEKRFFIFFPGGNFNWNQIASSRYNLAGTDVEENGKLDRRVRKRCALGTATFNDIRITTEAVNVQLNFTQTLPYYPWERWPPIYNGTTILDWTTFTFYSVSDDEMSPGVAITPPFNVTVPTIASLEINSLGAAFGASADANFPFKTPLNIRALDAGGEVITDGPDSILEVTVEANPSSACVSNDSSFQLVHGEAVFPGSICAPIQDVQLRFSVVSDGGVTLNTQWTSNFTVTGEFRIAGIFPIFAEVNTDLFTAAAVDLVNQGVWDPTFPEQGRRMEAQYYFVPSSDIQETLAVYDRIHTQNIDPAQPTIRAIIGSVTDEDTIALSRTSRRHQMPIMGYVTESSELSDKNAHPYFSRVSFGEGAKYYAEGAYLASHHWNKVIVIKDSDHPIPAVMYQGFEAHGVNIVLEVTVPALEEEPTDFSAVRPLDDQAEQIFAAGTRVIYTYTFAPNDIYLYHEAIRLRFAPVFGYQWTGNSFVFSSFPFTNTRGDCITLDPPCSTAFNGTLNLSPANNADLGAPIWVDHLYDAYTHQDPYMIPSATVWRWPSVLGPLSKGHDAAIAFFLGAVKIIERNETITGLKLAQMSRTVTFEGGSGYISFDENGDRPGFSATIFNYNPITDTPVGTNEVVWPAGTFTIDSQTLEPRETQMNVRSLAGGVEIPGEVSYAPINYTNTRSIQGYAPGSTVLETLVSQVPAAYWCTEGCGGGLAPYTNGTIYYYNYGTCVAQDSCKCKNKPNSEEPGYAGSACQQILCEPQCRNGECIEPDVCQCEPFWTGPDCAIPLCTVSGCDSEHGNCTGPNLCTCQSGYWGSDCAQRCTCENGVCNDGQGGTGTCSECNSMDFVGPNCDLSISSVVAPTIVGIAIAVTLIIVLAVWYIRRMKFRAALANTDWIVDYNDVIITADDKGAASSMAFRSMVSLHGDAQKQKNVIRNQGKWNGVEVSIKMLNRDTVPLTMQQRLEVKSMRDIRHQNLASFVGACCDSPNVCILMETAPKGSLDDILSSDAINLDWNFKYALLKDICRGMIYLSNTPIKSHGRLKSSNCVVDNRWTLKITDYGMHLFKSNQHGVLAFNPALGPGQFSAEDAEEGIDNSIKSALLYTAPELLRTGACHPDHVGAGSIQGDMYSLAIIMVEMLTHESPFHEYLDYVEVDEILDAIAGRKKLSTQLPQAWPKTSSSTYLRPTIPEDADPAFGKLIQSLWAEDPSERPTFQQVLKEFNALSPQRGDLMDNLIKMLEKYSTNLEAVVAERTMELAAEKAKTEELVCRMLPKSIVDQLKQGKQVSAESFDCVTIYFSDIVGFTKIAGGSTPLQVVDLLNDLYTCFDAIIDHFDVYKVETIGDAYMVVSGLPVRNGDQHAGEIASMSLHLLSAILTFTIRHMPETKLQLRIGIHSGPVVAGVVGLKMPRYCLFGDTVNTASRMESGGLALRIHMSDSTANILTKLGGYHIEKRGQREVKGKGIMTTYWLKNQDGFSRPLPSESMAVSESQHEFK